MVHTERPDWQSVMTYVTAIYKYFETWVHVLLHPTISSRPNPSTKSYYIDHMDNCISLCWYGVIHWLYQGNPLQWNSAANAESVCLGNSASTHCRETLKHYGLHIHLLLLSVDDLSRWIRNQSRGTAWPRLWPRAFCHPEFLRPDRHLEQVLHLNSQRATIELVLKERDLRIAQSSA